MLAHITRTFSGIMSRGYVSHSDGETPRTYVTDETIVVIFPIWPGEDLEDISLAEAVRRTEHPWQPNRRRVSAGKYEISIISGPGAHAGIDTVEIAVFDSDGNWVLPGQIPGMPLADRFDSAVSPAVAGYVTMEEVATLVSFLEKL